MAFFRGHTGSTQKAIHYGKVRKGKQNRFFVTGIEVRVPTIPDSSVAEPEPEPPEPYHFDPRRTGTVSLL